MNTTFMEMEADGTCRITCQSLTSNETPAIREAISACLKMGTSTIYLDTKAVAKADLAGINEVIHSAYLADKSKSRIIFIYKGGSVIENWVNVTGLDKFLTTAVIPSA